MDSPITEGCVCGAVRYECAVEPSSRRAAGRCSLLLHRLPENQRRPDEHERACPEGSLQGAQGVDKSFDTTANTGNTVKRHFCPECGSNLWSVPTEISDLLVIKAGSIDSARSLKPGMSIYCANAQPWAVIPASIPRFDKMPPM